MNGAIPTSRPSAPHVSVPDKGVVHSLPPLRILMVAARYFPYMGGIETHVHEVGSRLAAKGHEITVLTTDPTGELPQEEYVKGMRILRVKAWSKNNDYYLAPAVYRQVARGTWDVVHIQGYHTCVAPIAMLAAIRRKLPFVVSFHSGGHSSRTRNSLRRFQWLLLKPLLIRAEQLIGVSQFEAEHFSSVLGVPRERFMVVSNGAQLPQVPAMLEPQRPTHEIVSIGRLERYKGHHKAIEAFPYVLHADPDARLRILGEGPFKAELEKRVQELDLARHVTIGSVAPQDRHGVAAVLNRADLVVLLSEYEAHPVAVMEALSMARPVLVSHTSGFIELARQGLVRAIPLDSTPAQVAAAMIEEMRRERVASAFVLPNWNDCADRLLGIYRDTALRATQ